MQQWLLPLAVSALTASDAGIFRQASNLGLCVRHLDDKDISKPVRLFHVDHYLMACVIMFLSLPCVSRYARTSQGHGYGLVESSPPGEQVITQALAIATTTVAS